MAETVEIGDPPILVKLRRDSRAKRMTLRLSSVDGAARLTLPKRSSLRSAKRFLQDQEAWLRHHLEKAHSRIVIGPDVEIFLQDERFILAPSSGARVVLAPGTIFLPAGKPAGQALERFIKTRARNVITKMVEADSATLGKGFGKISLRDPRSRWGSCSSEGNLMFSWRLMLAPQEVLRYVVAHEVAHLREMNHAPAFWAEVGRLMPNYTIPRQWLRQNGGSLHRFDFKTT